MRLIFSNYYNFLHLQYFFVPLQFLVRLFSWYRCLFNGFSILLHNQYGLSFSIIIHQSKQLWFTPSIQFYYGFFSSSLVRCIFSCIHGWHDATFNLSTYCWLKWQCRLAAWYSTPIVRALPELCARLFPTSKSDFSKIHCIAIFFFFCMQTNIQHLAACQRNIFPPPACLPVHHLV